MANVAIIGASSNPERYSYLALKLLQENGHQVYLVSPKEEEIEGLKVYSNLDEISDKIDVITMYVNPKISFGMEASIISKNPKSVIFNPGTESSLLQSYLSNAGLSCEEACTLVLLRTGQFSSLL